ncbi:hypothetical protein GCM10022286_16340 [Gryllotalpicola daejeonensis]|uniref:Prepilin-type N-terminal cleavage/methylation domain-containing protein n=1 Tax=Gryllotalpicola daejeonensis TaxID=993087 RepID=A0ABP7ZJP0_9MICO
MIDVAHVLRRDADDSEKGLSLIELIVAMMVFSIIIVLVGTLYVTSQKVVQSSSVTSKDAGVASNVMNELTNVLRYGTVLPDPSNAQNTVAAFVSATPSSLVLYTYADSTGGTDSTATPKPVMVGFFLGADGTVTEKRWKFGATTPTAATVTSVAPNSTIKLGGPIIAPTTASPLAGVCQDPNATDAPVAPAATAGPNDVPPLFTYCDSNSPIAFASGAIPSASLQDISSVSVNISMNTGSSTGSRGIVLAGTIDMLNLGGKSGGS